jgi:hypothetical protein
MPPPVLRCTARALLLGERIDSAGLERSDVISTAPLAFRVGAAGYAVLFRYGVVVLIDCRRSRRTVLRGIRPRDPARLPRSRMVCHPELAPDRDDQIMNRRRRSRSKICRRRGSW